MQRAPDLLIAIKDSVFDDPTPGRFLLTGSADVMTIPTVAESLAGRMELHTLWPLAESEIERAVPAFVPALFGGDLPRPAGFDRSSLIDRLLRGGYPEVVRRPAASRRSAWIESYLQAVVQRDLREIAEIQYLTEMPRILRVIAGAAPGTLNLADLARDAAIPRSTLDRYLTLLEQVFLLKRLPPWHASLRTQQVRSPRLVFGDAAVLAHLLGVTKETLDAWDSASIGGLLENFVVMELVKQCSWEERPLRLYHWRTRTNEVDLVVVAHDGRLAGIEVKAAASVTSGDFRHLRRLRDASGDRWVRGIVLYTGSGIVPFASDLAAWPVSALWAATK